MSLTKSDFYFGALISRLMKTGSAPAIVENGDKRRIYSIENNYGSFEVYTKYSSAPSTDRKKKRWDITFTKDELKEINNYKTKHGVERLFCFICGKKELKGSEIMFLTNSELLEVIGHDYKTATRRVAIVLENGKRNYLVYGTAMDGEKQFLKIKRNVDNRLLELGFMRDNSNKLETNII